MAPKRQSSTISSSAKKTRKAITIQMKQELIKKYDSGVGTNALSAEYGLAPSTVSTIFKSRDKIMKTKVLDASCRVVKGREVITEMEKLLLIWLREKKMQGVSLTQAYICEKALEIYNEIKDKHQTTSDRFESFTASKGWFDHFKKRTEMTNVIRHGEAFGVDEDVTSQYKMEFSGMIQEAQYLPQQVFNVDETGLFWKKFPNRPNITNAEIYDKEKFSLVLGGNASGDVKIKPMLVYHTQTPKIFKRKKVNPANLGVFWRFNRKARVTRILFNEWLVEVFGPTVKNYLDTNNIPLKVLLLLDNARTHDPDLDQIVKANFPFLTVKYLPIDTTTLIQPMEQQVISNFKQLYTKNMFAQCLEAISRNDHLTPGQFWQQEYNICDAIRNVVRAWKEVKNITMNFAWNKLWPSAVSNFQSFETEVNVEEEIVQLGKDLSLQISLDDVRQLLQEPNHELTTQELEDLAAESGSGTDDGEEEEEEHIEEKLTTEKVEKLMHHWNETKALLRLNPNVEATELSVSYLEDNCLGYFRTFLESQEKLKKRENYYETIPQNPLSTPIKQEIEFVDPDDPQPGSSRVIV